MVIEHKKLHYTTVVSTDEWEKMKESGNAKGFNVISDSNEPLTPRIQNIKMRDLVKETSDAENYKKFCSDARKLIGVDDKQALELFKKAQKISNTEYVKKEISKLKKLLK